jgi:lysyl-tRNA synthetase class 1
MITAMLSGNRFDFKKVAPDTFWADSIAQEVATHEPAAGTYICAAGISPSGIVHFGNFRDVITSAAVVQALKRQGKDAQMLFSWDNFDRFRKVPANVDASFAEHIGKPLSKIPDPLGELSSYAERFQKPFVDALAEIGIELSYRDQTTLYEQGAYDDAILLALTKRREIAEVLLSFMTEKGKEAKQIDPAAYTEEYYPISVYSRFTGKDNTAVLSYDGGTKITYRCNETGKTDTVDLSHDRIAKLAWKIDWPMRWRHEGVSFEPAGHDHASPGGSYDVASTISRVVFESRPPLFAEYKFVGIRGLGSKMSGSKGNAISPKELLDVYDPVMLKWLYLRKTPQQSFELAFDSEIYRQYDEFDREAGEYLAGETGEVERTIFDDALGTDTRETLADPIPFRQAVGYGQIVQWNREKFDELLAAANLSYSSVSIEKRLPRAQQWLERYNREEIISLREEVNGAYAAMLSPESKKQILTLRSLLAEEDGQAVEELDVLVYGIPKEDGIEESELKKRQREFFKHVYNLLIGRDTGPRLGTFLWAIDRTHVVALLDIDN